MKWDGQNIRELSKNKKIPLQNLADSIGVSRQTVNAWINGQVPKGNHLLHLCQILEEKPDSFFIDNKEDYIKVPVHRTRRGAKINSAMQNDAILLSKQYANIFRNYKGSNVVPVIRAQERSIENSIKIASKLRNLSGISPDKPIGYEHTFMLAEELGINLLFRYFPSTIKGYAFYTRIYDHRVVFVNKDTKVIDLIFPLLHEFIHAIRDDSEFSSVYESEEEELCDSIANFIQFPQSYVEMVYETIRGQRVPFQVNMLKGYAKLNAHSLHGIVKAINLIHPSFSLSVGGADTNLRKKIPTIGDILFSDVSLRDYVKNMSYFSGDFYNVLIQQIDFISDRKLAEVLEIESVLDAKEIKSEIKNVPPNQKD